MGAFARSAVLLRFLCVLFFLAPMAEARASQVEDNVRAASTARRLLQAKQHSHWSKDSTPAPVVVPESESISDIFASRREKAAPPEEKSSSPAPYVKVTGDESVDKELGGAMKMIVAKNNVKKAAEALEEAKKVYYDTEEKLDMKFNAKDYSVRHIGEKNADKKTPAKKEPAKASHSTPHSSSHSKSSSSGSKKSSSSSKKKSG